jgi:hypothetical protein
MRLRNILIKLLVDKASSKINILLCIKDSSLKAVINKRIIARNKLLLINSTFLLNIIIKSLIFQ